MNRADIRQAIFDQIDWQPDNSSDLVNKINRFINRGYQQLALEAPFLFFEDKASFRTEPGISLESSSLKNTHGLKPVSAVSGTLQTATPGIVWYRQYTSTAATAGSLSSAYSTLVEWDWDDETDYTDKGVPHPIDGRWIEITDADDRIHRRRIRRYWHTVSTPVDGVYTHTDYLSLDTPLNLTVTGNVALSYRIYTHSYYLPSDAIEIRSMRVWDDARRQPINLIYADEAEEQWWDDIQGSSAAGIPRKAFRTDYFQMPSPTGKPEVSRTSTEATWVDDFEQPLGTFEFFYTICWGSHDKRNTVLSGNESDSDKHRRPKWESSPSPLSDEIQSFKADTGIKIVVTTPNIDATYGFYPDLDDTKIETSKSGYWKRFYARRVVSFDHDDRAIGSNPEEFFYVGFTQGSTEDFDFAGNLVNFDEPYRDVHGYSGIQLSPLPDAAYDVDVRYLRKPHPLNTDQAVPRLPPEAIDVLIQKALMLVYESLGNPEMASFAGQFYREKLVTLTKRYGSLPSGLFKKKFGRARDRSRRGYRFLVEER
tara:strand:- start:21038 stop:22651 length:1614 start_codon:yes stop_codon:yes gene_type:complete